MTPNSQAFDNWIRERFVAINTELETLYSAQKDRMAIENIGTDLKTALLEEGKSYIVALLKEGNTDEGFDSGFELLGNVGFYMAACRRHGLTNPDTDSRSPLVEASALSMQLGASLGVAPRFATSHLSTHNRAINGTYKSFTRLRDEYVFLEYNTRAILLFKAVAESLTRLLPLGISHPLACDLLSSAEKDLTAVLRCSETLFEQLDVTEFFYSVRPYYKPHHVGLHVYRGANAGDFSGINEIDLLLGVCQANDSSYSQLLVDKFLYMMPEDQIRLRDCMRKVSLLDEFLGHIDEERKHLWFNEHAGLFMRVCKAYGETARQHHDQLVNKFISKPAASMPATKLQGVTASGPPLDVLLNSLEELRDLRLAAVRDDIPSRYREFQQLQEALNE